MIRLRLPYWLALVAVVFLGGCATAIRPVNPPITQTDPRAGYRFETRQAVSTNSQDNLVILAFSGGGTRAAASAAFGSSVATIARNAPSFACSTPSMSSPAFPAAASRPWLTACMARSCSTITSSASSSVTSRASLSPARRVPITGERCRPRATAGRNWLPSCTTRSCSTAPPSPTSIAARGR